MMQLNYTQTLGITEIEINGIKNTSKYSLIKKIINSTNDSISNDNWNMNCKNTDSRFDNIQLFNGDYSVKDYNIGNNATNLIHSMYNSQNKNDYNGIFGNSQEYFMISVILKKRVNVDTITLYNNDSLLWNTNGIGDDGGGGTWNWSHGIYRPSGLHVSGHHKLWISANGYTEDIEKPSIEHNLYKLTVGQEEILYIPTTRPKLSDTTTYEIPVNANNCDEISIYFNNKTAVFDTDYIHGMIWQVMPEKPFAYINSFENKLYWDEIDIQEEFHFNNANTNNKYNILTGNLDKDEYFNWEFSFGYDEYTSIEYLPTHVNEESCIPQQLQIYVEAYLLYYNVQSATTLMTVYNGTYYEKQIIFSYDNTTNSYTFTAQGSAGSLIWSVPILTEQERYVIAYAGAQRNNGTIPDYISPEIDICGTDLYLVEGKYTDYKSAIMTGYGKTNFPLNWVNDDTTNNTTNKTLMSNKDRWGRFKTIDSKLDPDNYIGEQLRLYAEAYLAYYDVSFGRVVLHSSNQWQDQNIYNRLYDFSFNGIEYAGKIYNKNAFHRTELTDPNNPGIQPTENLGVDYFF